MAGLCLITTFSLNSWSTSYLRKCEICKGTISVQWICPFPCSVKSTPSLTRVQVFGKISSSVLRRDLLHFSPENPKGATIFQLLLTTVDTLGFYLSGPRDCFFLGFYLLFFILIFFFLFQIEDKAAWQKYKVQMGVKLKHKVTDEKTW